MRLEPINNPNIARKSVPPAIALLTTILITSVLAMLAGANPFSVFGLILEGAFGSQFALLETLNRATPLIFTGLAVAVAFRAKFWNIGAEAQLYAGALITILLGTGILQWPASYTFTIYYCCQYYCRSHTSPECLRCLKQDLALTRL